MPITRESQYAVRAVYELAGRREGGLTKMADIAESQAIPERFLEVILSRLRRQGIIESKRGKMGGHRLATDPSELTVGQVLRIFDEHMVAVDCLAGQDHDKCPLHGKCPYEGMWKRATEAVGSVYDTTTFQDLMLENS